MTWPAVGGAEGLNKRKTRELSPRRNKRRKRSRQGQVEERGSRVIEPGRCGAGKEIEGSPSKIDQCRWPVFFVIRGQAQRSSVFYWGLTNEATRNSDLVRIGRVSSLIFHLPGSCPSPHGLRFGNLFLFTNCFGYSVSWLQWFWNELVKSPSLQPRNSPSGRPSQPAAHSRSPLPSLSARMPLFRDSHPDNIGPSPLGARPSGPSEKGNSRSPVVH